MHEIWHVYYVGYPTYTNAKILNKNKNQDGGRQTAITQPPIDVDEWNFAEM